MSDWAYESFVVSTATILWLIVFTCWLITVLNVLERKADAFWQRAFRETD